MAKIKFSFKEFTLSMLSMIMAVMSLVSLAFYTAAVKISALGETAVEGTIGFDWLVPEDGMITNPTELKDFFTAGSWIVLILSIIMILASLYCIYSSLTGPSRTTRKVSIGIVMGSIVSTLLYLIIGCVHLDSIKGDSSGELGELAKIFTISYVPFILVVACAIFFVLINVIFKDKTRKAKKK